VGRLAHGLQVTVAVMAAFTWPAGAGSARLALGQFCDWLPGEGLPGTDGVVYATTTWDPDGSGPQPEVLIAGGGFTVTGQTLAGGIAAWDGATWQVLGSGTNGCVQALTVHNGELIAGGLFSTAGDVPCLNIARWNGSNWQPLGNGIGRPQARWRAGSVS